MIVTLLPVALSAFLLLSSAAVPQTIEGKTGAPRPAAIFVPMPLMSRAEYEDDLRWRGAPPHRWPEGLTTQARYGSIFLDGERRSLVVDEDSQGAYTLRIDFNGDGDLTSDSGLPLKPDGMTLAAMFEQGSPPAPMKLVVELDDNGKPGERVRLHSRTEREGVITVGTRQMAFVLLGIDGRYDHDDARVFIDIDLDGKLDTTIAAESGAAKNGYANIGDASYELHVDPRGDKLSLVALSEKRPDRPTLEIGSLAPEFAFRDVYGLDHHLADYRGKFVLLYFWGTWCTPCVVETPRLRETYEAFKHRGFEIVGINRSDLPGEIRAYGLHNELHWPQSAQGEDGPILALYRVNQYPTTFLLDRSGKIVTRDIRAADLAARLSELLGS